MKEKYILFDLDGTLSDSAEGITKSVAYALEKYGIYEKSENLAEFVGPPLVDMFMEKYGFSEKQAYEAVSVFRERFQNKGIYENCAYDGAAEMLKALHSAGKIIILATSKPEKFARMIIERYGFTKYFHFIGGASMDEKGRTTKEQVINYCLSECGITDYDNCIMVGDTKHDALGASRVGIKTVGVLYGYGSKEDLEAAGAVHICENINDLLNYLIK